MFSGRYVMRDRGVWGNHIIMYTVLNYIRLLIGLMHLATFLTDSTVLLVFEPLKNIDIH